MSAPASNQPAPVPTVEQIADVIWSGPIVLGQKATAVLTLFAPVIQERERLRSRIERLEGALRVAIPLMRHNSDCPHVLFGQRCECGRDEFWANATSLLSEAQPNLSPQADARSTPVSRGEASAEFATTATAEIERLKADASRKDESHWHEVTELRERAKAQSESMALMTTEIERLKAENAKANAALLAADKLAEHFTHLGSGISLQFHEKRAAYRAARQSVTVQPPPDSQAAYESWLNHPTAPRPETARERACSLVAFKAGWAAAMQGGAK